jgi:hypothetical protein
VARRTLVVLGLVVTASLCSACGYTLAGRGSFLPETIRTIGIPNFVNKTPLYQAEQVLTERVRSEFIGRGKFKVLPQETGVDAVLYGEISSITLAPAAFSATQQASRYTITLTAKIEFRDATTNKVLWQNPSLVFRDDYDVASATAGTFDLNTFFGQEANALERVGTNFARSVVSAILEAF